MKDRDNKISCSDCGVLNCYRRQKNFPDFCLTTNISEKEIEKVNVLYRNDSLVSKISHAAAEIEGTYYGKLTRVEEIIAFAKRIGAKKIGIATCIGLMNETKIFTKILKAKGLESYSVICKVGSIDKTEIGILEELKIQKGCHEALCNPVLQAKLLNKEKTDLNVIVGLCVGHDSLFIKYSKAPVTTLITKDRVLGHNPAAALYNSGFYYKRLLDEGDI
ncbi:DUF1847 domain-containing protein [Acetivibrio straminisolvens]|jgi:uncharacterized metal-binding protein|uniref:Metal-binding protein n=1 Tax=Acetivibrio straminisolvens JCM 21531 TaxID=1294263 RepID=W4V0Z7_9FIRM|nr:DUF1847 domain-containing protein [Acetivibrio straminisolvens]GAE86777.1 hypothetical protein JCM21531_101 [Acetivibrio straminisolvens JCM 21531]